MRISYFGKQHIIQLYYQCKVSFGQLSHILRLEGLDISKRTIWNVVRKYKAHGTLKRLEGSGRHFKLTAEAMTIIEEQMKANNETTATQLRKLLEDKGFSVSKTTTICARQHLGWTFHGRRYCQIIRVKNKEKRVKWALENAQNSFDSVVWTDESMIQLENHRAFCYRRQEKPQSPSQNPRTLTK